MIDYNTFRSQIAVPEQLKPAYQKLVIAGMKLLFSEKGNAMLNLSLDAKGSLGDRIGRAVSGAMIILVGKIKSLPAATVYPAAMELVLQTFEYAEKSGEAGSKDDLAEAVATVITALARHMGKRVAPPKQQAPAGMLNQPQGAV